MTDEEFELVEAFTTDFAKLVRQYVPVYDSDLLMYMQERTSCYNPYVWSKEFDK